MSNILIVESKNDKIFIESLIKYIININVNNKIIVDEYESLNGLSETTLIKKLESLNARNFKNPIDKIGILLDIDDVTLQKRLDFVNKCIQKVFPNSPKFDQQNKLYEIPSNQINIATYFTNVNGQGELETVLKAIKTQDSSHADCLESWQKCIENKEKNLNLKDFNKFWITLYIRYDTCSDDDRKQAGKKCSMSRFEYIMKEKSYIWDFEHEVLKELKDFLQLFT